MVCHHAFVILVQLQTSCYSQRGSLIACFLNAIAGRLATGGFVDENWEWLKPLTVFEFGNHPTQELKNLLKPGTEKEKLHVRMSMDADNLPLSQMFFVKPTFTECDKRKPPTPQARHHQMLLTELVWKNFDPFPAVNGFIASVIDYLRVYLIWHSVVVCANNKACLRETWGFDIFEKRALDRGFEFADAMSDDNDLEFDAMSDDDNLPIDNEKSELAVIIIVIATVALIFVDFINVILVSLLSLLFTSFYSTCLCFTTCSPTPCPYCCFRYAIFKSLLLFSRILLCKCLFS